MSGAVLILGSFLAHGANVIIAEHQDVSAAAQPALPTTAVAAALVSVAVPRAHVQVQLPAKEPRKLCFGVAHSPASNQKVGPAGGHDPELDAADEGPEGRPADPVAALP